MCLTTNTNIPSIAAKDIIVYKIIREQNDNSFVTPYQKYPITLNSLCKPKELKPNITSVGIRYVIDKGVIHSYYSSYTARCNCYFLHDNKCKVIKAIIPEGAKYWKEYVGAYPHSICSTELFITDEFIC